MRRTAALKPVLAILAFWAGAGLASPAPAAAQTLADYDYIHLTFRGIGVAGGYLWSDHIEDTEEYTLRIDLGYLGPGIRIAPSLTYWSSELAQSRIDGLAAQLTDRTGSLILGSELAPIEWSDLSLNVDGHFVWSTPVGVLTFVGAGLGLHALNGQGPAVDGTFVEDLLDDITAGVNALAGLEFEPLDNVRVFGEGRYTAMSSLSFAVLRAGVQVMLSRDDVTVGSVAPAPDPGRAP